MLPPITIRYPVRPGRRSLAAGQVADLFGLAPGEPPHPVAEGVALDVRPGDLVLFTGPSGSGKSSLLRAAGRHLSAIDASSLELPDVPLVDALPGPVEERLAALAGCGLSEPRLALRTPGELSDGERYRFRVAYALSVASGGRQPPVGDNKDKQGADAPRSPILLDEFAAHLDRPLAKVLAFNLRKLVWRAGVGVLAATTHEDVAGDLNPDLHVRCLGGGLVEVERREAKKNRSVSRATFGSRTAPGPTGRNSRGGITGAGTPGSSAG